MMEIDMACGLKRSLYPRYQSSSFLLDNLLQIKDLFAREEWVQSSSFYPMDIRTGRGEGCLLGPETAIESWTFPVSRSDMVDFVAVIGITEVDFVGSYANDRAYYNGPCQCPFKCILFA